MFLTLFFRIQTEQANEIARLIRQYITIDQKSRDTNGNQQQVCFGSSKYSFPTLSQMENVRKTIWLILNAF